MLSSVTQSYVCCPKRLNITEKSIIYKSFLSIYRNNKIKLNAILFEIKNFAFISFKFHMNLFYLRIGLQLESRIGNEIYSKMKALLVSAPKGDNYPLEEYYIKNFHGFCHFQTHVI